MPEWGFSLTRTIACKETIYALGQSLWENTSQRKPAFWHILRSDTTAANRFLKSCCSEKNYKFTRLYWKRISLLVFSLEFPQTFQNSKQPILNPLIPGVHQKDTDT